MAKKTYLGVDGVARKVKKGYVGLDDVARKIRKAYIGIGGVARPCWSDGNKVAYYGKVTSLSVGRGGAATATVGGYGLFCGGPDTYTFNRPYSAADAYNTALTRVAAPSLRAAKQYFYGTQIGDHAIFGGGSSEYYNGSVNTVDAYDEALTRTVQDPLSVARWHATACTVGGYALFAGGGTAGDVSTPYAAVDVYDTDLTHTLAESLSLAREASGAANIGRYVLFVCGALGRPTGGGTASDAVDAYDLELTHMALATFGKATKLLAGASVGTSALFGGGIDPQGNSLSYMGAYNSALTFRPVTELSLARHSIAAAQLEDQALFCGGGSYNATVDVYNDDWTRSTPTGLSAGRSGLAAVSVGEFTLLGAGSDGKSVNLSLVEAYTILKGE